VDTGAAQILEFINLGGLLTAGAVLVITWLVGRLLRDLTARAARTFEGNRLVVEQVAAFLRFAVYVLGVLLALRSVFAFSKEMMTVLGGTLVVTIGLVLKDQAASIIAGLIILVEKPFQVGDRISFAGFYGDITSIGLRSVRLVTLDDSEVTIPNSKFLTDLVSSANSGALTMLVQLDFHVGADQDFGKAKTIVESALRSSRYFLADRPSAVLINQVVVGSLIAVRLRAKAYVIDLRYEKAFESDVTQKVLLAFKDDQILPPALHHRSPPTAVSPVAPDVEA